MKIFNKIALLLGLTAVISSCNDTKYEVMDPIIAPINADAITGSLQGDDYVWTWPAQNGLAMQVNVLDGNTLTLAETVDGNTFTHPGVDTNIEYTYVFKLTDGSNISSGVVKRYTRAGASKISGVSMSQIDKAGGYDALVEWNPNESATSIRLEASNGSKNIGEDLPGNATSYTIPDVV